MTAIVRTSDSGTTADNTDAVTLAAGDTLFVSRDATLFATGANSNAIDAVDAHLTINGEIYAAQADAIRLSEDISMFIGSSGSVFADNVWESILLHHNRLHELSFITLEA